MFDFWKSRTLAHKKTSTRKQNKKYAPERLLSLTHTLQFHRKKLTLHCTGRPQKGGPRFPTVAETMPYNIRCFLFVCRLKGRSKRTCVWRNTKRYTEAELRPIGMFKNQLPWFAAQCCKKCSYSKRSASIQPRKGLDTCAVWLGLASPDLGSKVLKWN